MDNNKGTAVKQPEPIKQTFKFKLATANNIADFEGIIEVMINDDWQLSGELVVTPLPITTPATDKPAMQYTQPLIKSVNPINFSVKDAS